MGEVRFSSKRFLLTLTLCACSVILLQNGDLSENSGFTEQALAMFAGLAVCAVLFIPAILLKRKTDQSLTDLLKPRARIIVSVIYAAYFLYAAEYFLLPYTDMFCKKYYPQASPCLIALALCAVSVYAAVKGVNVISRFGIFLFFLALVTNMLMFFGAVGEVNFSHSGFGFEGGLSDFFQNAAYFITPAFIIVIYVFLSGCTNNFRVRQPVIALAFMALKYALVLFFICFSAGSYAHRQEYQTFVLSRVAHFGTFAGIESFYMALATMSVFLIVSLLLCSAGKGFKCEHNIKFMTGASAAVFAFHFLAIELNSLWELFTNEYIFIVLTIIAAFIIPLIVLLGRREKSA